MPIGDTILLQKKYAQIYYIWVWNYYFFTCTFTLNILPMYCLVKTFLLVILMLLLHRVRRCRRPNVRDKPFYHRTKLLYIYLSRGQSFLIKKEGNIMQAAENRFSGPWITVKLLDCFNSPHLATTQQSLNCQVAHVRTVKQFGCLRSSVRRSIIFYPYWLIKSETRYWETSCHLIPAWMSNHMHISMEWNHLILIHSQTSALAPFKISNG